MTPYIYTGLPKRSQRLVQKRIPELTHERIIKIVRSEFMVSEGELKSKSRKREIVIPRQIAMFFIKKHTKMNLVEIGDMFNRDHSTVIYSIGTVNDLIETDKRFREKYEQVSRKITQKD